MAKKNMSESVYEKLFNAKMTINLRKEFALFRNVLYHYPIYLITENEEKDENVPCKTAYITYGKTSNQFEIYFYEEFLKTLTKQEVVFVILHEIMHSLLMFFTRVKDKNFYAYNIANDHVINLGLQKDIEAGRLGSECKTTKDMVLFKEWSSENLLTDEVYERLMKNNKQYTISEGKDGKSIDVTDENGNTKNYPIDVDKNAKPSDESGDKSGPQKLVERILAEMRTARDADKDRSKSRGNGSGGILDILDSLLEIDIPLDQIFRKAIASKQIISLEDRSWRSLNSFYRPHGLSIPGNDLEDKLDCAFFCIDNSGSMNDDDLRECGSAISKCDDMFDSACIIWHDTKIIDKEFYEDGIHADDLLKRKSHSGTCHQDVFDYIEEVFLGDECSISIVMILSDMESNVESLFHSGEYEWCREVPIQIVLPSNRGNYDVDARIDSSPITIKLSK